MSGFSDIKEAMKASRRAFVSVGVFSCFINLLMLTGPLFMLQVYDRVLMSKSFSTLASLSILMVTMYAFMGILDLVRARVLSRVGMHLSDNLSERTFHIRLEQGRHKGPDTKISSLDDLTKFTKFISGTGPGAFSIFPGRRYICF